MTEYCKRDYLDEEEFLEEFSDEAHVAAKILDGNWYPKYNCNDNSRRNRDYFLKSGELQQLLFDSAGIYYDENGFSSVQILLRSSTRIVNVRVKLIDENLVAEIIVDKSSV